MQILDIVLSLMLAGMWNPEVSPIFPHALPTPTFPPQHQAPSQSITLRKEGTEIFNTTSLLKQGMFLHVYRGSFLELGLATL